MFAYYRSFSLYRRSLNTLSVGMLLAVVVLTLLLSQVFSGALIDEARQQAERTATVVAYNIDRLYRELLTVAAYLGNDNANINTMMFQTGHDRLREYAGFLAMRQLQSTYSSISFIAVYNQNMDSLACTVSLTDSSKQLLKAQVLSRYRGGDRGSFTLMDLRTQVPEGVSPLLPSLALFFYSPLSTGQSAGAVIIGVNCYYMQSYIGAMTEDERQTPLLATQDGRLISHPDSLMVLMDHANEPYMTGVLAAQSSLGTLKQSVDGREMMVTYLKSPQKWIYISMIPYHILLEKITSWRNLTLLIASCVTLMAIAYSLLGARHTFRPIETLMDDSGYPMAPGKSRGADLDFLNEQIAAYRSQQQTRQLNQQDAVRTWLRGELPADRLALVSNFLCALSSPPYRLALLAIDLTDAFRALDGGAQHTLLGALGDYVLEALRPLSPELRAVELPPNRLAVVLAAPDEDADAHLPDALRRALGRFHQRFSQACCAALSGPISPAEALPDAFHEAAELLTERFYAGNQLVAVFTAGIRRSNSIPYDARLEYGIWQAAQERDEQALDDALSQLMTLLNRCAPETCRLHIRQLLGNLLANRLVQIPGVDAGSLHQSIRRIEALYTLEQIRAALPHFLLQLIDCAPGPPAQAASRYVLERAIALSAERYADPAFSLNDVAESLQLSASYFNRTFKKLTGESFSGYLNGYRLHQVCMLLRTTAQPLAQICRQVGITNESYCYTLFKKEYGVTPSRYRARYRAEDNPDGEEAISG